MKQMRRNDFLASISLVLRCIFAGMLGYLALPKEDGTEGKEGIHL